LERVHRKSGVGTGIACVTHMVLMVAPELLKKDMTGKVVVVTGGNSGIGTSTCEQLAKQGATVVLCCRCEESGKEAAKTMTGSVDVMQLDLADLTSVKSFAEAFKKKYSKLDILVNNAGVMNCPFGKTKQGFEMQFGTNHLGHFALTTLLLPHLKNAQPSRLVVLSSVASENFNGHLAKIDLDDLNFETRKYDGWVSYGQSKLANVLFAKEFDRLYAKEGVRACSLHPGFVQSNLMQHTMGSFMKFIMYPVLRFGMGMIKPWEGVQTSLHCILADTIEPGAFYSCGPNSPRGYAGGWPRPNGNPVAEDAELAKKLWDASEKLIAGNI